MIATPWTPSSEGGAERRIDRYRLIADTTFWAVTLMGVTIGEGRISSPGSIAIACLCAENFLISHLADILAALSPQKGT